MSNVSEIPHFHVAIDTSSLVPKEIPADFRSSLESGGLLVIENRREHAEMFAAMEWFIPTAMMVFLAKPYFESFLSEMGKDHYLLLKKGLTSLIRHSNSYTTTRIASNPNKRASKKYSLGLSVFAEADGLGTIKFLFEEHLPDASMDQVIDRIVSFVAALQEGRVSEDFTSQMVQLRNFGRLILVAYDQNSDEFIILDARPTADPKSFPRLSASNLKLFTD